MNYKEKQKELAKKYKEQISGISRYNKVDIGVAFDMLIANGRQMMTEEFTDYYKGGGVLNFDELIKDIIDLDKHRR